MAIKVIDRRGEEKPDSEPIADIPQPSAPEPQAGAEGDSPQEVLKVSAKRDELRTTTFFWDCPKCKKQERLIHCVPGHGKPVEALGGGGEIEYSCQGCQVRIKVTQEKVVKASTMPPPGTALPGINVPMNRQQRRIAQAVKRTS